jgi:4-hydroxy-tetrahydrodipicolinate synthase
MKKRQIRGIISGPVAPFRADGELDEETLRRHLRFLIEGDVHVLLAGTIVGEFPSLSLEERKKIIDVIVDETNNKVPVYSGAGGSDFRQALSLMKYGEDAGADGIFLIPPAGYTLSVGEVYDYAKSLTTATDLPVMLYNTASSNISPSMYKKLIAEANNIDSVKESNQAQLPEVTREVGDKIAVLTSKDDLFLESALSGAAGVASVLSALAPRTMVELYEAFESKDIRRAAEIQYKIMPISKFMLSEGMSAPLKAGLEMLGIPAGSVRKPHLPLSEEKREALRSMMKDLELLKE